jgi:hypothetical protein
MTSKKLLYEKYNIFLEGILVCLSLERGVFWVTEVGTFFFNLDDRLYGLFLATDPEVWVRFRLCHIFSLVGLEWGPLSFVSTIKELLGRNSSSGLENRKYGCRDEALT